MCPERGRYAPWRRRPSLRGYLGDVSNWRRTSTRGRLTVSSQMLIDILLWNLLAKSPTQGSDATYRTQRVRTRCDKLGPSSDQPLLLPTDLASFAWPISQGLCQAQGRQHSEEHDLNQWSSAFVFTLTDASKRHTCGDPARSSG